MLATKTAIKIPTHNPKVNAIHGKQGLQVRMDNQAMVGRGHALNFQTTLTQADPSKALFGLGTVEKKMKMIGDN